MVVLDSLIISHPAKIVKLLYTNADMNLFLTFKLDKSMLGDTEFDNLLFLWYDEKYESLVELETEHDKEDTV